MNSVDSWGRNRIEGYGFLEVPSSEGFHVLKVQTWKPRGNLFAEIHSFFLGGSIRILDLEELVKSYHVDEQGRRDIVNRFGIETEDSGEIIVRLNVISCNTERKKANREVYDVKREEKKQELHKLIMEERVKHIKRKKLARAKGNREASDEESDGDKTDGSEEERLGVIKGADDNIQPSHQNLY